MWRARCIRRRERLDCDALASAAPQPFATDALFYVVTHVNSLYVVTHVNSKKCAHRPSVAIRRERGSLQGNSQSERIRISSPHRCVRPVIPVRGVLTSGDGVRQQRETMEQGSAHRREEVRRQGRSAPRRHDGALAGGCSFRSGLAALPCLTTAVGADVPGNRTCSKPQLGPL